MADKYNMDFINSLGPLMVKTWGDETTYALYVFCIETGCMTMNVCVKPQNLHFDDVKEFVDWNGDTYDPDGFYL